MNEYEKAKRIIQELLKRSRSLKEFLGKLYRTFNVEKVEINSLMIPGKRTRKKICLFLFDTPRTIRINLNRKRQDDLLLEKLLMQT